MPEGIINLRKEFDSLVDEAKAFFDEAARRGIQGILHPSRANPRWATVAEGTAGRRWRTK